MTKSIQAAKLQQVRRLIALISLSLFLGVGSVIDSHAQAVVESPRLARLQSDLARGDNSSIENFWREINEKGSPLIESIAGDTQWMLVTFLWRAQPDTKNVIVVGRFLTSSKIEGNEMSRLGTTEVFYKTYRIRAGARFLYSLSVNDPEEMPDDLKRRREREHRAIPDPLNPHRFVLAQDDEYPNAPHGIYSLLELPGAPAVPAAAARSTVPHGEVTLVRIRSKLLNVERRLWIYTPAGYHAKGSPYGLVLMFDGSVFAKTLPTSTILDNLIADRSIPPMVAVMIDNPMGTRGDDLSCSQKYMEFLSKELMPWVRQHYHVTDKAAQTVVTGFSLGGLSAACAGYYHPELFGKVLANSGSFWWRPDQTP